MKPICVRCQRFFRPKKNSFHFIEGMPVETAEGEKWQPYKLWAGDLWACECGIEIIVGVAQKPIREHYQPDFKTVIETLDAQLQVNDC